VLDLTVHGGLFSPSSSLSGSVEQYHLGDMQGNASWYEPLLNPNSCHFPSILVVDASRSGLKPALFGTRVAREC
jgi:hypothetical protein